MLEASGKGRVRALHVHIVEYEGLFMNILKPLLFVLFLTACATDNRPTPLFASARSIDVNARASWNEFMETNEHARALNAEAAGVLIFPNIVRAGFIGGGHYGDGVMIRGEETLGYYNSSAASYGLQAGAQRYGYALIFTNEDAINYLNKSMGLEIGVGPSIVIVNKGLAANWTSTTLRKDIYVFMYGQQGLMAGSGIQGTKVTRRMRKN